MRLPESEKQKITTVVKKITDEFREAHKVKIRSYYGTTRQANESGLINFILHGMKQYDLSFHDYLWSEHLKEAERQYDRKIVRSSFYTKYKSFFEN